MKDEFFKKVEVKDGSELPDGIYWCHEKNGSSALWEINTSLIAPSSRGAIDWYLQPIESESPVLPSEITIDVNFLLTNALRHLHTTEIFALAVSLIERLPKDEQISLIGAFLPRFEWFNTPESQKATPQVSDDMISSSEKELFKQIDILNEKGLRLAAIKLHFDFYGQKSLRESKRICDERYKAMRDGKINPQSKSEV
jgi:hypothetical protein